MQGVPRRCNGAAVHAFPKLLENPSDEWGKTLERLNQNLPSFFCILWEGLQNHSNDSEKSSLKFFEKFIELF